MHPDSQRPKAGRYFKVGAPNVHLLLNDTLFIFAANFPRRVYGGGTENGVRGRGGGLCLFHDHSFT